MIISNDDFDSMVEAIRKRIQRHPEATFFLLRGDILVTPIASVDSPHCVVTARPAAGKSITIFDALNADRRCTTAHSRRKGAQR